MMRVLIVEDNSDIADSLSLALSLEGHVVDLAVNGKAALELLARGPLPQLILLDITMPVMSGADFLLRRRTEPHMADIPVILMSAAHDRVRQGILLEVDGHIRKPMDINALLRAVALYADRPQCGAGAERN